MTAVVPRPKTIRAAAIGLLAAVTAAADTAPRPDSASAMIKAGLPVFETRPDAVRVVQTTVLSRPAEAAEPAPGAGVVRMMPYVAVEKRPLTAEAVMSDKGLARFAMDEYLGPVDGFDRGFLNVVTLRGLWSRIPVLNIVDFAGETNAERAMRHYRLRRQTDLLQEKKDFDDLSRLESSSAAR